MVNRIIEWSLKNKFLVVFATIFLASAGLVAMVNTPLDAIPDLSDVQVIIYTDYAGQAPQVVEEQVTYPLTTAMLSVPYAKTVRGYSFFGSSFVYIIFEDGTDLYWARSRVLEYLNFVSDRLPDKASPKLGPDATGVGWIYEYVLEDTSGEHDLKDLRSIQDWYLKYELTSVPGVSEVASIGGYVKQYQVEVDPNKLLAYNLSISRVKQAIQRSNTDVGGRLIEMGETEFMVRGLGYIRSRDDLAGIAVGVDANGTPILLSTIANIHTGPELRRGILEWNGKGEVAGGIVVMRYGENALEVISRVKKKLSELKKGLPEGVEIRMGYDRSGLIQRAIQTLTTKLVEEMVVVALVCVVFLLHFRSAFVAILTLPAGILVSLLLMYLLDININIMSLGGIAIAIGVMVDASVVMVENTHKHLERDTGKKPRSRIILDASKEVGPALFYSLLIITISFLPVFSLGEQSGRLFKPLAYTKTFAMAASAILAVTIIPVLMTFFVRGRILPEKKNPVSRVLISLYLPLIRKVLTYRKTTLAITLAVMAATAFPAGRLGSEFMPPLNEGDLLYMPTTLPGISVTKAREILQQTDKIIMKFPEVKHVLGKIGRAETATDPAPLSMIESTIMLHPQDLWRNRPVPRFFSDWPPILKIPLSLVWPTERRITIKELARELDRAIQFPGLTNAWTMPIRTRIDMLSTGIKTPVGIKIMGPDLDTLSGLGEKIEALARDIPGTLSAFSERVTGGNYLDFRVRRHEIARYGLTVSDVQEVIMTAIGGMNITWTVEGLERYPVNLRYSRQFRGDVHRLKRVLVTTPSGAHVPLAQLADISVHKGPAVIKSENARRTAWVYVDLKDVDVGSYVKQAKQVIDANIDLPDGYSIVWSGQFEYMERARKRLNLIVPLTLGIIFILLYLHFRSFAEAAIVMGTLPFALVGGIWLLYALGYHLSVAVVVGFIALAGLAAETGVVMLVYLDEVFHRREKENRMASLEDLYSGIIEGAVERVRPKIMTVATTLIGLLPVMWGTGAGSQVMKRIAAPMVGGLISSTVLTLLIIPVVYFLWKKAIVNTPNRQKETLQ